MSYPGRLTVHHKNTVWFIPFGPLSSLIQPVAWAWTLLNCGQIISSLVKNVDIIFIIIIKDFLHRYNKINEKLTKFSLETSFPWEKPSWKFPLQGVAREWDSFHICFGLAPLLSVSSLYYFRWLITVNDLKLPKKDSAPFHQAHVAWNSKVMYNITYKLLESDHALLKKTQLQIK